MIFDTLCDREGISSPAVRFLLMLVGIHAIEKRCPAAEEFPTKFGKVETDELFIELSEKGLIKGTPTDYTINFKKLNIVENAASKEEAPPSIAELFQHFKTFHK